MDAGLDKVANKLSRQVFFKMILGPVAGFQRTSKTADAGPLLSLA